MASRSKFVLLGRRVFQSAEGRPVRGAFDTTTAGLYLLPTSVADALDSPDVAPTPAQTAALARAGLLTDIGRADAFLHGLQRASEDLSTRTFILMPTPACNMGCDYCGQNHNGHSLKTRYEELVVPRVVAVIRDPATRVVNIDWFGGEPLLAKAELFSIASRLMAEARKQAVEYRSQLTTNGSLFSVSLLRRLIGEAGVTRVDVTVDGPQRIHDLSRKMKNGASTYDRILDSVSGALAEPWSESCQFIIRTNVTMETLPHVTEYLRDLAARGLCGDRGPAIQIAPVHQWGIGTDAYEVAVSAFAEAEIEWLNLAVDLDVNFLPLPDLADEPCSAGHRGTETIDPQGTVYDCPELALRPPAPVFVPLGRRPQAGAQARPDGALMADMTWSTVIESPPCRSCSLLPVCGGACALSRAQGQAQCPSMKHNFADRIDVAVRRALAANRECG
ncbi:radical SAM/SPASM domain-containing protein [Streptomyces sp. NRRL F-5126]|uniref:radical SAM/SPASM domain-containing protein n=1 Tax=Streptomyces sp. NRRL F-5126 TaxID=1463857 RepID=UPI0004C8291E|nr:radical SAM protein [Streptomyces sp. NRRL F-5126]